MLRMLTSMATKGLLAELAERLAVSTPAGPAGPAVGQLPALELESAGGVVVAERIRAGEDADLVVLSQDSLSALAAEGLVRSPVVPLFTSEVAIGVAENAPVPDLTSAESMRAALAGADTIGYSTGPSGAAFLALLDSWALRDELASRLVRAPAGTPVATLIAEGRVSLGIQQRSELQGAPGVRVVGPLPRGAEIRTVFSGAVMTASTNPEAAGFVLDRLADPALSPIARRHGMESFSS